MDDREQLILLNGVPGIGSTQVARLLETLGTLKGVWHASEAHLRQAGLTAAAAARLVAFRSRPKLVEEELALARRLGCEVVTRLDAGFPEPLRQIPDPPLVLYRKGAWPEAQAPAVAMVGSRRASAYGRQTAERLAAELAMRGVTVVSGLALGIDAAAHHGALKGLGRTIAVLGNGLADVYPPQHRKLAEQIVESGCLISEYPMRTEPLALNFPRRNRLISGLSLGVIVVEAADKSGALITADCALEQGREVFAVPGPVDAPTSRGTHQLLKQGARLLTSVEDVVEELRLEEPKPARTSSAPAGGDLTEEEARIVGALDRHEPRELDLVVSSTGLPVWRCAVVLSQLELRRAVTQLPGKRFVRND